jgi:acyl-coenzyme A thioesterase PaaI-like protein
VSERLFELIRAARLSGDWHALAANVPYMAFLGMQLEHRGGRLLGRLPYAESNIGNPMLPALHGGALAAALESAAQFEMLFNEATTTLPKTITATFDYLRSGRPVDTFVHAKVFKQGRRVCTVHVSAWQDDETKPIATATVQLLILGSDR